MEKRLYYIVYWRNPEKYKPRANLYSDPILGKNYVGGDTDSTVVRLLLWDERIHFIPLSSILYAEMRQMDEHEYEEFISAYNPDVYILKGGKLNNAT